MKDIHTKEVIVKLVNTSSAKQEITVDLKGSKLASNGSVITLTSPNLQDENTFVAPRKISLTESEYKLKGEKAHMILPAYSVSVLKLKMK